MDAQELRRRFLAYFAAHDHAIIGSAPLIPEHDPSVLFTTAGMHPLVPYLLGEHHPAGARLANVQKCLRTDDIAEVGDAVHLTFFEMAGSWSLGDYWKPEAIALSYRFLTEELGLDPARLRVTCFAGDADAPRDAEAVAAWAAQGIPPEHVSFQGKEGNWWGPVGLTGPCGPDSEIFYDMAPDGPPDATPASDPARFWEIWNNVFLQYDRRPDGSYAPLAQRNVDTGLGVERVLAILEGVPTLYETELFVPILDRIQALAPQPDPYAMRVIADHVRAAVFILAEGIVPGKVDQPYIARRLIRRAVRYGQAQGITGPFLATLAETVIATLGDVYPELEQRRGAITAGLDAEEARFARTLRAGEQEFARVRDAVLARDERVLPGEDVFLLYTTFGFPVELTGELAAQAGLDVDTAGYAAAFAAHQALSREGATARFQGGLATRSVETARLHTATHLLQAALRQVLGPHVSQRGSNITPARLRFDFTHPARVQPEELAAVEALVNAQIAGDLPVTYGETTPEAALAEGALGFFGERYGPRVKVYRIGDFSAEILRRPPRGPHRRAGPLPHRQGGGRRRRGAAHPRGARTRRADHPGPIRSRGTGSGAPVPPSRPAGTSGPFPGGRRAVD